MLIFIDESYVETEDGTIHHALAGFGIDEAKYRKVVVAIHQAKLRHFRDARGLSSDELTTLRTTAIACKGSPDDAEIKAGKLLTAKAARYHLEVGPARSVTLVEEILDEVRAAGGTVFGVLSSPGHVDELQRPTYGLPLPFRTLFSRIDRWMGESHPDRRAILVFDAISAEISRTLNRAASDSLFKSPAGKRLRHLMPTPLWVDSDSTPGSQVADIVAHVLMNSMLPEDRRKPLPTVRSRIEAMEYRSVNGAVRGVVQTQKQQTGTEVR